MVLIVKKLLPEHKTIILWYNFFEPADALYLLYATANKVEVFQVLVFGQKLR
jgi:hypothetical protein